MVAVWIEISQPVSRCGPIHHCAAGFSNDGLSVLFPDTQGFKDFAHEKNTKEGEAWQRELRLASARWNSRVTSRNRHSRDPRRRPIHRGRSSHGYFVVWRGN